MFCFSANVYNGSNFCPSVLQTVGIHIAVRNFRNFSVLNVSCDSTVNTIYKSTYILFLLEDYCLIMERRFAHSNDPESYAGGSGSSW
jgi:hypothetical protein